MSRCDRGEHREESTGRRAEKGEHREWRAKALRTKEEAQRGEHRKESKEG
jgi:hypothetical protein